jgi:hypothetical protein
MGLQAADASPSGASRQAMGSAAPVSWHVRPPLHSSVVVHSWVWPGVHEGRHVAAPPAIRSAVVVPGEKQQTCDLSQFAKLEQDRLAPFWHCPTSVHANSAPIPREFSAQQTWVAVGHAVAPHSTVPTAPALEPDPSLGPCPLAAPELLAPEPPPAPSSSDALPPSAAVALTRAALPQPRAKKAKIEPNSRRRYLLGFLVPRLCIAIVNLTRNPRRRAATRRRRLRSPAFRRRTNRRPVDRGASFTDTVARVRATEGRLDSRWPPER